MNKKMKFGIYIIFILSVFASQGFAQDHSELKFDCSLCHACETPTKSNPCLIVCPRQKMVTVYISAEKSPKIIKMEKLKVVQHLYEPVIFSHRVHAEMSELSGGCEMCHHYNPPGNVVPCINCHEPQRKRLDISKPDLKAAYHRQCINCHSQWSDKVACESCHELLESGKSLFSKKEYKEERIHPEIIVPAKLVYKTSKQKNTLVTFYHNEHNKLFGFECKDCHHEESCVRCHVKIKTKVSTEIDKDFLHVMHVSCNDCHNTKDEASCVICHKNEERKPFDHKIRTGFELRGYHKKLSCLQCHKSKNDFTGLNSSCMSCHFEWHTGKFDHKVTGLELDELHAEFDCNDCHKEEGFSQKTSCKDCHDEKKYPDDKPGKLVK
jgi:hypothetical protein